MKSFAGVFFSKIQVNQIISYNNQSNTVKPAFCANVISHRRKAHLSIANFVTPVDRSRGLLKQSGFGSAGSPAGWKRTEFPTGAT